MVLCWERMKTGRSWFKTLELSILATGIRTLKRVWGGRGGLEKVGWARVARVIRISGARGSVQILSAILCLTSLLII